MGADAGNRPESQPPHLDPGVRPEARLSLHQSIGRSIGARYHGITDYLLVIILTIGPSVAGFAGRQATLAYVLAVTLFLLAVLTRFPLGVVKVVGFPTHGAIELLIGLLLLILPWLANFASGIHSRTFYVTIAMLLLLIWFMTDFRGVRDRPLA